MFGFALCFAAFKFPVGEAHAFFHAPDRTIFEGSIRPSSHVDEFASGEELPDRFLDLHLVDLVFPGRPTRREVDGAVHDGPFAGVGLERERFSGFTFNALEHGFRLVTAVAQPADIAGFHFFGRAFQGFEWTALTAGVPV